MKSFVELLFLIAGTVSVVYGAWMVYRPIGWIIGGIVFIFLALLINKHEPR